MGIIECWLILLGLFCVQEHAGGAKENLAPRGTASQSSTYNDNSADLAVDGVKDFSKVSSSCAITSFEQTPWWRLDLQVSYRVNIVVVTYREDCCPDRWSSVEIHLGNSLYYDGNKNPRCFVISVDPATSSVTYSCRDLDGRYLNVLRQGWWHSVPLLVCEVEVYESDYMKRSFMKLAFNSSADLTNSTVMEQVLKELTSALAARGITNVTLRWSQTPEEKVTQIPVENDSC